MDSKQTSGTPTGVPSGDLFALLAVRAEITEQSLRAAVREVLWMALCYNDHNFQPGDLLEKAEKVARLLKVQNVDDANQLLNRWANTQDQTRPETGSNYEKED